jgi:hypothetical protein
MEGCAPHGQWTCSSVSVSVLRSTETGCSAVGSCLYSVKKDIVTRDTELAGEDNTVGRAVVETKGCCRTGKVQLELHLIGSRTVEPQLPTVKVDNKRKEDKRNDWPKLADV